MTSKFKVLSDREHLLLRPSMYIGSISNEQETLKFLNHDEQTYNVNKGLLKIIDEIIDNSIDETLRNNFKVGNKIDIKCHKVDDEIIEIVVSDNGKGIPNTLIMTSDGKQLPQLQVAFTTAKSGSNFTNDNRITVGMNGIGAFATNVFSESFIAESVTSSSHGILRCKNNSTEIDYQEIPKKSKLTGTTIIFRPDLSKFETNDIDETLNVISLHIQDRLSNIMVLYPKLKIFFNDVPVENVSKYYEFPINLQFKTSENKTFTQISLFPVQPTQTVTNYSIVNGVKQSHQDCGTHVNYIYKELHTLVEPKLKRLFKHKVSLNQFKNTVGIAVWFSLFPNPMFDSQNKTKLTNSVSEIKEYLSKIGVNIEKLAKELLNDKEFINHIKISLFAKLDEDELKELSKLTNSKKNTIIKSSKHIQASKIGDDNYDTCLYITEGLSAISNLLPTRNAKIHGGYALRGKVLNVYDNKQTEVLKNTELYELSNIIGLINHNKFDYYKVILDDGKTIIACKGDTIKLPNGELVTV